MYKTLTLVLAGCLLLTTAALAEAGAADDQYNVAAGHYRDQRWKLAAEEFQTFLSEYPADQRTAQVTFFLGETLVQLEQFAEARQHFQEFLRRAPKHRYARRAEFRQGETAYLSGQAELAKRDLQTFAKNRPDDPLNGYVLPYLGELAFNENDHAAAKDYFTRALKKYPANTMANDCRFGLARALEGLGEVDEAARFYGFLIDQPNQPLADDAALRLGMLQIEAQRFQEAQAALADFAAKYPDSPWKIPARYWLAKSFSALQEAKAAHDVLNEASQQAPPVEHELAVAWAMLSAEAARRAGDAAEARQEFEHVVKQWPRSEWADDALQAAMNIASQANDLAAVESLTADFLVDYPESPLRRSVLRLRGRTLLKTNNNTAAAGVFTQIIAAGNQTAYDAYYLGLARLGEGRPERALEALRRVGAEVEQESLQAGVQAAIAAALVALERWDESIEPLRKYLELAPQGADAAKSRAQLTVALARLGRMAEAADVHAELSRLNRERENYLPTTHYLAETAYRAGEINLAKKLFEELAEQKNSPAFQEKGLAGLAWLQFENEQHQDAAATFERLLAEHPESSLVAEAALMRGKALEKADAPGGALAMYRLVYESHPEADVACDAMLAAARIYDDSDQEEVAISLFSQLVARKPNAPGVGGILYQWAWALVDLKRVQEADQIFARLSHEHAESRFWADATYRVAEREARGGNYEAARKIAQKITAAKPSDQKNVVCHATYLYGQSSAALKDWPNVNAAMKQVLEICGPGALRIPAEYWVAESLYRMGQYEEAGRRFDLLRQKTKDHPDAWLAMAPLRQAQVLAQQKKWSEAYLLASSIAESFPTFRQQYEVDYLMGRCLVSQAKFEQARRLYEQVVRSPRAAKTETAAMAQWMIGETYFHQKHFDEAVKAYHRVVHLFAFPQWQALALLQAGKCHEMQAEWKEAVELYAQLLRDFGDTNVNQEASRRLRVARERLQIAFSAADAGTANRETR